MPRQKTEVVSIKRARIAQIQREHEATALEAELLLHLRTSQIIPAPLLQFRFAAEYGRDYRVDFAWPDVWLLAEVEGGTFAHERAEMTTKDGRIVKRKSRHLTATGFHDDCDKYNFASILGYHVLRFDAKHVSNGQALQTIELAYLAMTQYDEQIDAALARAFGSIKKIAPLTAYRAVRAHRPRPVGGAS